MKKKITVLFIILTMLIQSVALSSCVLIDSEGVSGGFSNMLGSSTNDNGQNSVINVEGGDNFDVTINSSEEGNILAASKALLSAVSIQAVFTRYGSSSTKYGSAGSGVIYKLDKNAGDAYIITNHHVVYSTGANTANRISSDISVYLYGQESEDYKIPATYVGGSLYYDLAVLKVDGSQVLMKSNARAADFANSDDIAVLETAIAIGNPESGGISATVGHVNVDSEYIEMLAADDRTTVSLRVIRTDAAVNSGNSGGGLFNAKGELIGIVNAKLIESSVDGIGYAIPSNVAKYIAENIIYYCDGKQNESVQRCMLGITVTTSELYTEYDTETGKIYKREKIAIHEVDKDSAVLDKLKAGDIFESVTIDGTEYAITRQHHVIDSMLNARPSSKITFKIIRDGEKLSVSITATEDMLKIYP